MKRRRREEDKRRDYIIQFKQDSTKDRFQKKNDKVGNKIGKQEREGESKSKKKIRKPRLNLKIKNRGSLGRGDQTINQKNLSRKRRTN